jgi:hypothetical protein
MTFGDWVSESVERFQTEPAPAAAKHSVRDFGRGIVRRTLDPMVGRPIWERGDWDVLLVLDACRVDLMQETIPEYDALPDQSDAVWSNASCSIDWIDRTFNNYPEQAKQTGYVTANPFVNHNAPDTRSADLTGDDFAYLDELHKTHWQDIGNGIETVPAEVLTDHAIQAWRDRDTHGFDQLVVHYMQPHEPFRSKPEWGNGDHKLLKNLVEEDAAAGSSIYPRLRAGEVSMEEFWDVYQDNLSWVLDDVVDRLLNNCDANIVLTSDHGNGLGDWWSWHHPPGRVMPPIRRVPWIEVDGVDHETVTPSLQDTAESDGTVERDVNDRLAALGYK